MTDRHVIIIGGGLAGLSAGCYALRNGYRATIIEHNLALGGVCTAWTRGPYTIDGCIHWLTGGPFTRLYEELEILPTVSLRTLDTWCVYRDARDGLEVAVTRDLDALVSRLSEISKEDKPELERIRDAARAFVAHMAPPLNAPELASFRETLHSFWEMRGALPSLVHFRKPVDEWAKDHLVSPRLRRVFTRMLPETAPALLLLMILGYLEQGYLSRPVGGTAAFRDALERTYRRLGGEAVLHATVDEVLVRNNRAYGVRLADGTMRVGSSDNNDDQNTVVISTASAPESVLRLLGGRYDADDTRERLRDWKLFDPIVLASFGVERSYATTPSLLVIDHVEKPLSIGKGGKPHPMSDTLHLRVCNDDPCFAPPGHTVVQAMLSTDYEWWATRGTRYGAEKDAVAEAAIAALEPHFPELRSSVRMIDLATPITYWSMARSWRGAFEGWMPSTDGFFGHVKKKLSGLEGFYMAGQWVEPGGGVPTAIMSGRQVMQLVCRDSGKDFAV